MTALDIVRNARVVPVLRGADPEKVLEVARTLLAEGFTTLEATFTVPGAEQLLRELARLPGVTVGAGTVTRRAQFDAALEAGAAFLVSPGLDETLLEAAAATGTPYLPGVFTPSETMRAAARGFRLLKLFPGSLGGPDHLWALAGPFPELRFMPTGGVDAANLAAWAAAGAVAVGMGSSLTGGTPEEIRARAAALRSTLAAVRWRE